MSTVKTNNVQVGNSGTASNNFTWYQPTVPDGTVRLGQGNSGATTQDVIKCDSSGNLTIPGSIYQGGGTIAAERIVQGTAQTTNGAASYEYTGLPSWVKRITFQMAAVNWATGGLWLQIGSGSYTTSGYTSSVWEMYSGPTNGNSTTGSGFYVTAAATPNGDAVLTLISGNLWVMSGVASSNRAMVSGGYVTLSGTLDRIRIATTTGSNFIGGTVNIIYEG